ncbi:hypothetical protein MC885_001803 [Smutsia gigantea]|nr:hypothetical protein MC885_001803 [Smutsia gigantea]
MELCRVPSGYSSSQRLDFVIFREGFLVPLRWLLHMLGRMPCALQSMGNSYAGQLKTTRFEEVLHNSIEASLRSNSLAPRPVFSQLYLEAEQQLSALEGGSRVDNEDEEEEGEGALEPNCASNPYQTLPPPEGCCTTDGEPTHWRASPLSEPVATCRGSLARAGPGVN